jgi:dTDP-4-dehydrorhamnose reductase
VNSNFAEEESYVIVGRDGRLASALLKTAASDLNKELIFSVSARNLEIDLISTMLIPSQTLNVIWSSGWAGARSDKETCKEDFRLFSLFIDRLFDLKCNHINFIFLSSGGTIYGNSPGPVTENSPVNPNSHYADMKLRSEELLLNKPSNKITPLVLRLANLYGSNLATTKTSLIDECINNFPKGTPFSIFANLASQKQYGTFQDYAMSVLEATKLMCAGMNQNRVLNLFPPHLYTVKEILEITSEFFEVDWSKLLGHSLNDLPLETTILMNADGIAQPPAIWESLSSYLERIGLQDAESKIK